MFQKDDEEEYIGDEWPMMEDGKEWDGTGLLDLFRAGKSPLADSWNLAYLIEEVESVLDAQVVDIPLVTTGANNLGLHFKLSNRPDAIVRLSNSDVNFPHWVGRALPAQVSELNFEAATYRILQSRPEILASPLLHYRAPFQRPGTKIERPNDIAGRRMMIFEMGVGSEVAFRPLSHDERLHFLGHAARIRASLFNFDPPKEYVDEWLPETLFRPKPDEFPAPITPTRDFCIALFESKIRAYIKNLGDMIGWESDHEVVGPRAFAAKASLLRFIPHMLPPDNEDVKPYRLVLDHLDFGYHNMTMARDEDGMPEITSVFDWETGCIVPALLSNPMMITRVDLILDEAGKPTMTRISKDNTAEEIAEFKTWVTHYFEVLFEIAPNYRKAIDMGKDARYLWNSIREWRGGDSERFFGGLGEWAEKRMKELGV